jgi:cell wall arabinan synthesis protein
MPGAPANGQSRGLAAQRLPRDTAAVGLPSRSATVAVVSVAACALLAALVAALGPARDVRSNYSWPPATLPAENGTAGWYAPLALLNRVPGTIEVHLPCAASRPQGSSGPVNVLSTARRPEREEALRIVWSGRSLLIGAGDQELARVPWPEACPLDLQIRDGKLHLPSRTIALRLATLAHMPVVTGLFSGLDLQSGARPRVEVQTRAYTTSQTPRQIIAAALASALACAALLALAFPATGAFRGLAGRWPSLRRGVKSLWAARDRSDIVVVGVLIVWWVVAPTFTDDGWLWVEDRRFQDLGTISFYFDIWGLASPLGYWVEWLRHWELGSTQDLIWLRLPTLLVLLASWPLCKWCARRVVPGEPTRLIRWSLAGVFLLGATAWGMTLRLEPVVSLLTLCGLAAVLSFIRAPRLAPLTIAFPAAVLAATAHPAGTVSAAPVLVSLPYVGRWLRAHGARIIPLLAALLSATLALALVLFTLDADLRTRLDDARIVRAGDLHSEPWWHEYMRYTNFDGFGGGTAIRRLSLALLILATLSALTRRRLSHAGASTTPGYTLAIGLGLLAFVPSKWPWHFGTLAAVGAVAMAAEVAHLISSSRAQSTWPLRQLAALLTVSTACLWAWWGPIAGSPLELQTIRWSDAFNRYPWLVGVPALVCAAALSEVGRARKRRDRATSAWAALWTLFGVGALWVWWHPGNSLLHLGITSWRDSFNGRSWVAVVPALMLVAVAAAVRRGPRTRAVWVATTVGWVIPVASLAFVGNTIAGLSLDAARSNWSPARQNLGVLTGHASCGLADQLAGDVANRIRDRGTTTLLVPSLALYFPCATIPKIRNGVVQLPNLVAYEGAPWPLQVKDGPFAAVDDLYATRKIAQGLRDVEVLGVSDTLPDFTRADAVRVGP